jgi:hypothetical protein
MWLPSGVGGGSVDMEALRDIRGWAAARVANGEPALRCGRCKSPRWDEKLSQVTVTVHPVGSLPVEVVKAVATAAIQLTDPPDRRNLKDLPPRKRCKHGLMNCSECRK